MTKISIWLLAIKGLKMSRNCLWLNVSCTQVDFFLSKTNEIKQFMSIDVQVISRFRDSTKSDDSIYFPRSWRMNGKFSPFPFHFNLAAIKHCIIHAFFNSKNVSFAFAFLPSKTHLPRRSPSSPFVSFQSAVRGCFVRQWQMKKCRKIEYVKFEDENRERRRRKIDVRATPGENCHEENLSKGGSTRVKERDRKRNH